VKNSDHFIDEQGAKFYPKDAFGAAKIASEGQMKEKNLGRIVRWFDGQTGLMVE
jgi:hypothetical protein